MTPYALQTQNLCKRYGSLTAVENLTLDVYEGEILGFLGPNGAGKSTSINMMCGLLRPDSGRVFIQGKPVLGSDANTRFRVGVCPQNIVVWEKLTCLEQLQFIGEMYGMPGKISRQRARLLLEMLDLVEKSYKLAGTLSGGLKRRLNLALALVHDPEIVVLDEPEAGLDPQSRLLVRETIQSLARQKTVIMTTHNMDEAERLADRVAIIDHGKLLVVDTPKMLKRTVGEGDVLEIEINGIPIEQAEQAISGLGLNTSCNDHHLVIRCLNIVEYLPSILEKLNEIGAQTDEVHLRANSLEDVFIRLTGGRLRE